MRYIVLFLLCSPMFLAAQIDPVEQDSISETYIIIEGDSIPKKFIGLDEVIVLPNLKLENRKERIRYYILRRKTIKVYPYAKLAAERLVSLQERLDALPKQRQKKKYAKIIQKYIENEFSEELKKLTKTEGQILVKLIHRQTGKTTFKLIKELRSGWRAFWFNSTASLFNISLKREFVPLEVEEDFLIEDILLRAFQNGQLDRQKPAFEIDYYGLNDKWMGKKKSIKK
ncbi:MAG: DUF4294 domain-containing protein [Winogradskyella sp.]|nr:DUF4294 domain-containing protein [Winogradskyella sp.]NNK22802.1 DUF4294 domain-containing protein [Winogradskyella sp.]